MIGMIDPIVPGGGGDKPRQFALDEQSTVTAVVEQFGEAYRVTTYRDGVPVERTWFQTSMAAEAYAAAVRS